MNLSTTTSRIVWMLSLASFATLSTLGCASAAGTRRTLVLEQIAFNRGATNKLLEEIEKTGRADQVLRWQAAPGRASIGWQLMHLAATEDAFAARVFGSGTLVSEQYSKQFRSGQVPSAEVPSLKDLRAYLTGTRQALELSLQKFAFLNLDQKPSADARFNYQTALNILLYHEAHHQGQARATFNLYLKR